MAEQAPPRPEAPARRGRGRPDALTPQAETAILAAVANHQRIEVAYELAGVKKSTFYGWLQMAAEARMYLERPGARRGDLTRHQRRCLDFSDTLTHAMASAEGYAVRDVVVAGSRPIVERRQVVRKRERCVGLNSNGNPIMVTETTEDDVTVTRPPDWRARAFWLQTRVPAWRQRHELTGPGGGPLEVEFTARLATLADTIRGFQEEQAAIGPGA